jgi:hypothetical protein
VEIECCANYDRDHGAFDALDPNNSVQATELRNMHDQELLRCACTTKITVLPTISTSYRWLTPHQLVR